MSPRLYVSNTYFHLLVSLLMSHRDHRNGERATILVSFTRTPLPPDLLTRLQTISWAHIVDATDRDAYLRIDAWGLVRKFFLNLFIRQLYPWINPKVKELAALEGGNLFLFNDFSYISRYLMRAADNPVCLVEDGASTYAPPSKKRYNRFMGLKRLLGLYPFFGRHPKIEQVLVQHPDRLPEDIRTKACLLDMKELLAALPAMDRQCIKRVFFDTEPKALPKGAVLVLTQPFYVSGWMTEQQQQLVFGNLIRGLENEGFPVVVKTHPADKLDYRNISDNVHVMEGGFPIELINLMEGADFLAVLSVNSSASENLYRARHRFTFWPPEDLKSGKTEQLLEAIDKQLPFVVSQLKQ